MSPQAVPWSAANHLLTSCEPTDGQFLLRRQGRGQASSDLSCCWICITVCLLRASWAGKSRTAPQSPVALQAAALSEVREELSWQGAQILRHINRLGLMPVDRLALLHAYGQCTRLRRIPPAENRKRGKTSVVCLSKPSRYFAMPLEQRVFRVSLDQYSWHGLCFDE